jgi:hypothetical protein
MTATTDNWKVAREYEPPEVKDYGKLSDLTAGSRDGEALDASFPVNTLRRELTFS